MKEYILKLDSKDIAILSEGLALVPFGKVAYLVSKIQMQIRESESEEEK
jgi:hypothetical protein